MYNKNAFITFVLIGFIAISFATKADQINEKPQTSKRQFRIEALTATGDGIPDTWSFTFEDGAPMDQITEEIESDLTACTVRENYGDVYVQSITCPDGSLDALLELPLVSQYALSYEQELRWKSYQTQTSPPWGIDRTDQRNLPLTATYNTGGINGANVEVHVLDTGVLASHTDFGGRVSGGYNAFADGVPTTVDCQGHGTHVAGTIGGSRFGVAKNVAIYSSRVLDCTGSGSTSGIISAIRWVINRSTTRRKVINMSLGGEGTSPSLDSAVASATTAGVTVVVAAGNENVDACGISPARAPTAITVMATDRNDRRASFSNFGTCCDINAPGVNILSAGNETNTDVLTLSGTSMASPHVAGVAALVLQAYPRYSVAQVTTHILNLATNGKVIGAVGQSTTRLLYFEPPSGPVTDEGDYVDETTNSASGKALCIVLALSAMYFM